MKRLVSLLAVLALFLPLAALSLRTGEMLPKSRSRALTLREEEADSTAERFQSEISADMTRMSAIGAFVGLIILIRLDILRKRKKAEKSGRKAAIKGAAKKGRAARAVKGAARVKEAKSAIEGKAIEGAKTAQEDKDVKKGKTAKSGKAEPKGRAESSSHPVDEGETGAKSPKKSGDSRKGA